jgi:hypothetical protein
VTKDQTYICEISGEVEIEADSKEEAIKILKSKLLQIDFWDLDNIWKETE